MNNHQSLNSIRLIIILSIALVFGVVLHRRTFNDRPAFVKNLAVAHSEAYALNSQAVSESKAVNNIANDVKNLIDNSENKNTDNQVSQEGDTPLVGEEQLSILSIDDVIRPKNLSARSAIITDKDANLIIYQKNINERLPMASITKLMTAVVVLENLDSETRIKITKTAVNEDGAAGNLRPDEELALLDLMKIMLITSSNDAAYAVKEYFADFNIDLIALMNQKAEILGMSNTRFSNTTGLDQEGHFSTAYDLAKLASYVFNKRNDILNIITQKQATVRSLNKKITHLLLSTNQLLQENTPEMMGGKTGYTKNASGCMLSILQNGKIIVVLGSEDRFGETKKLIKIINKE